MAEPNPCVFEAVAVISFVSFTRNSPAGKFALIAKTRRESKTNAAGNGEDSFAAQKKCRCNR